MSNNSMAWQHHLRCYNTNTNVNLSKSASICNLQAQIVMPSTLIWETPTGWKLAGRAAASVSVGVLWDDNNLDSNQTRLQSQLHTHEIYLHMPGKKIFSYRIWTPGCLKLPLPDTDTFQPVSNHWPHLHFIMSVSIHSFTHSHHEMALPPQSPSFSLIKPSDHAQALN